MANNLKQIDAPQVLRSVYDVGTNCLRVCLVDGGAGEGPGVEVIIDHTTDSIRLGDGTSLFTGTTIGADVGLDVNLITTDIDIRDLDANLDNVAISDGTDEVSITDVAGKKGLDVNLITQDVDIRTLTDTEDSIAIGDGTDLLEINGDGSINSVVTATDLDVRDLTHVSDSVKIGDGTETANVNTSNELQVRDDDANTTLESIDTTAGSIDSTLTSIDGGVSDGNDLLTDIEDNTSPRSTANYALVGVTNTAVALNVSGTNLVGRKSITIQPKGSTIYVGFDNTVTSGNNGTGIKVSSGSVITFPYDDTITIYAIKSGGGTANTFVSEDL